MLSAPSNRDVGNHGRGEQEGKKEGGSVERKGKGKDMKKESERDEERECEREKQKERQKERQKFRLTEKTRMLRKLMEQKRQEFNQQKAEAMKMESRRYKAWLEEAEERRRFAASIEEADAQGRFLGDASRPASRLASPDFGLIHYPPRSPVPGLGWLRGSGSHGISGPVSGSPLWFPGRGSGEGRFSLPGSRHASRPTSPFGGPARGGAAAAGPRPQSGDVLRKSWVTPSSGSLVSPGQSPIPGVRARSSYIRSHGSLQGISAGVHSSPSVGPAPPAEDDGSISLWRDVEVTHLQRRPATASSSPVDGTRRAKDGLARRRSVMMVYADNLRQSLNDSLHQNRLEWKAKLDEMERLEKAKNVKDGSWKVDSLVGDSNKSYEGYLQAVIEAAVIKVQVIKDDLL